MLIVCDSSGLIALHAIGRLDCLHRFFGDLVVPAAVARDIRSFVLPQWIRIVPVSSSRILLDARLGAGETEAIQLAVELSAQWILVDDADARVAADRYGLRVIGIVGVLLNAKKSGMLSSLRNEMDKLIAASFHISPRLYRTMIAKSGEV